MGKPKETVSAVSTKAMHTKKEKRLSLKKRSSFFSKELSLPPKKQREQSSFASRRRFAAECGKLHGCAEEPAAAVAAATKSDMPVSFLALIRKHGILSAAERAEISTLPPRRVISSAKFIAATVGVPVLKISSSR